MQPQGLSDEDRQRLSEDIFLDRRISGSVYCASCGYNLRDMPYVYNCPECGASYNARPLQIKGIFSPYDISFPLLWLTTALVLVLVAAATVWLAVCSVLSGWLAIHRMRLPGRLNLMPEDALLFAGIGVLVAAAAVGHVVRKLRRFFLQWRILRRMESES